MKVLLVGAGGYGANYVKELLNPQREDVVFEGIVDPYVEKSSQYASIKEANIPTYDSMDSFYSEHAADLAVISTPVFLHCEQSITALKNGSNVLCEKPIAPTMSEAQAMLDAQRQYGKFIAIGYQWSFSDAILSLKKDVLDGTLGDPISMKTAISWPRNFAYYRRGGGWAGRAEKDGYTILDSIASNACAHYLHNMLFLLGDKMESSAYAKLVCAECLRANDIEMFDTCSISANAAGVPIYFIASHVAERNRNPEFEYKFEKANLHFSEDEGSVIVASFSDGREKIYGNPFENGFKKLWDCIDAISAGKTPICRAETAMPHTALIGDIHSSVVYKNFEKEMVVLNKDESGLYVKDLFERMYKAYALEKMLSEI